MVFGKVTKSSKGTIVDQDNMGALGIAAVLSEADPRKALSESAVGYWGGDHYVTTTRGNRTCVTTGSRRPARSAAATCSARSRSGPRRTPARVPSRARHDVDRAHQLRRLTSYGISGSRSRRTAA